MGLLWYSFGIGEKLELHLPWKREDAVFYVASRRFYAREDRIIPRRYYQGNLSMSGSVGEVEFSETRLKSLVKKKVRN